MGWRGALRTVVAMQRASEREAQKRHREHVRHEKALAKQAALESAAEEVEAFDRHLESLVSVHKIRCESVDWRSIQSQTEPPKPVRAYVHETVARKKIHEYNPGFITRTLGGEERAKLRLQNALEKAQDRDREIFNNAFLSWKKDHDQWKKEVALASGVRNGLVKAKTAALRYLNPFTRLENGGLTISIHADEKSGLVTATLALDSAENIIPSKTKSLLQSGKVSTKKMPVGRYYDLYQDYICSCILRVGNEILGVLEDDLIVINATIELLNTSTGHQEQTPIVSVAISRKTLSKLNLSAIDPSDAMANFVHRMNFNKTKGFLAVEPFQPPDFEAKDEH